MITVGSYEAKTHLPRLLDEVAKGERVLITKHGVSVAVLSPAEPKTTRNVSEAIERLKDFGKSRSLGGVTARELIEEGRRF
jgi:prevent-host-death family protein